MKNTILIKPNTPQELKLVLLLLNHLKIQNEVLESTEEKNIESTKRVDTLKYCGTVKFGDNPVEVQRQMRDGWR